MSDPIENVPASDHFATKETDPNDDLLVLMVFLSQFCLPGLQSQDLSLFI